MLRYARLWWRFVSMAVARETAYRTNFAVNLAVNSISLLLAVLTYHIVYTYTSNLSGWSQADALIVLGIFRMVSGLVDALMARNMWRIADDIRTGDMDYLLLRPVSSQFLATLRDVNLSEATNALIGLGLALYSARLAGIHWNLLNVAVALSFALCGLALLYAVWCVAVTFAFWFQSGPFASVFYYLVDTGRYPVTYFKGPVRLFLTFAFPVAFASTFPAQALRGIADLRMLVVGVAMAGAFLVAASRFWTFSVRHYSSASS